MNKTYETFSFSGKSINCYGIEVVKNSIKKYGYLFEDFNPNTSNTVLFSLYWPEQIYDFIKWRYAAGMDKKRIIVGGNTATTNPSPIVGCDKTSVFLGDAENWNGNIDSEYMVDINTKNPVPKSTAETITPVYYEDVQDNRRAFCEISRGCMNKCLFCQYGWLKKYNECDIVDIKEIISRAKTKSIRLFSADRFQHSRYKEIRDAMKRAGKNDTGSDVSLRFVYKNPEYLKYTNKVRVGIEGMSERLRYLIGKKYSDEQIIEFCLMVASAGIKSLDWYMIYGLPTEGRDDVDKFRELLIRLDEKMPTGYTLCIHWNAFTPSAQTPFERENSAYHYNATHLNKLLLSHDNKNIKIYHKPKLTGKNTIALRCIAIRSDSNCVNLLHHIAKNKAKFSKNPDIYLKEFEKITGYNPTYYIPDIIPLPWQQFVDYPSKKLLKISSERIKKYK